jgi:cell division protein FtsL
MSKFFTSVIIGSLVIQIVFSFFYSSEILTQNGQLDQIQTKINQTSLEIESLQKKSADLDSIVHLNLSTPSASLKFIDQSLNLKH